MSETPDLVHSLHIVTLENPDGTRIEKRVHRSIDKEAATRAALAFHEGAKAISCERIEETSNG